MGPLVAVVVNHPGSWEQVLDPVKWVPAFWSLGTGLRFCDYRNITVVFRKVGILLEYYCKHYCSFSEGPD